MRQSALLITALVALAQLAVAQPTTKKLPLDGKAVSNALHDFFSEMRTAVASDTATWSKRAAQVRQDISDRLSATSSAAAAAAAGGSSAEATRRRLLNLAEDKHAIEQLHQAKLDATKDLLSKSWDLIVDGGGALKNAAALKATKIHEFFHDILGDSWKEWVPAAWLNPDFSFDKLGGFTFSENLQDFVTHDHIEALTHPQSLGDLYDAMEGVVAEYCKPDKIYERGLQPTACFGPMVNITLIPKYCTIDEVAKQIVCEPAKLVLLKIPGTCTLKYYSHFQWVGKRCALTASAGWNSTVNIGGAQRTVPLGNVDLFAAYEQVSELLQHHHPAPGPAPSPPNPVLPSSTGGGATVVPIITQPAAAAATTRR